jgi:Protein of unknown function (DUF2892)
LTRRKVLVTEVTERAVGAGQDDAHHHPAIKEPTMFKTNVGGIDRALRIVAGLTLLGLAATGVVGPWGWIGAVPLATGLLGTCPAYTLLGLNTCPAKTQG